MGTVNGPGHESLIVETSKDGERWRFFGKAWKRPGEEVLLHAVPRYVRFRPEWEKEWREPLERTSDLPMTLLLIEAGARSKLWPDAGHVGLPMLLPGGEEGRLLSLGRHGVPRDGPTRWSSQGSPGLRYRPNGEHHRGDGPDGPYSRPAGRQAKSRS